MALSLGRAQLQAAIAARGGRPPRRVPRSRYPKLIELEYGKAMIALVDRSRTVLEPLLHELPSLLASARAERGDARMDIGETQRVRAYLASARNHFAAALQTAQLDELARKFGQRTADFQGDQLKKQVRAAMGIDVTVANAKLPTLMDHFVHENVALIESIPEELHNGVEQIVTRAFTSGRSTADVAADIEERFDISERRARFIARDQLGKLNSNVTAYRHKDLGIRSFIWRNVGDERVRDEHRELQEQSDPAAGGTPFSYDDPPVTEDGPALPGEPPGCRCGQEPSFADVLGGDEDDE